MEIIKLGAQAGWGLGKHELTIKRFRDIVLNEEGKETEEQNKYKRERESRNPCPTFLYVDRFDCGLAFSLTDFWPHSTKLRRPTCRSVVAGGANTYAE